MNDEKNKMEVKAMILLALAKKINPEDVKPITAQEWAQLTYWQRKHIYYLACWYVFIGRLKNQIRQWRHNAPR